MKFPNKQIATVYYGQYGAKVTLSICSLSVTARYLAVSSQHMSLTCLGLGL